MSEALVFAASEAEAIRALLRRAAQDFVTIGQKLATVKSRLKHGEWGDYLRREFDWNERTAQRFMSVAERFKNDNLSDLNIAPSALYLLAAASTPEAARTAILARAQAGERITHSAAKTAINAARPQVFIVDSVFSQIMPRPQPEEYARMEASILSHGVYVSLKVWRGILVDGHVRYEICHKHGIPFKWEELDLADRYEALEYIMSIHTRADYTDEQMAAIQLNLEKYLESVGAAA